MSKFTVNDYLDNKSPNQSDKNPISQESRAKAKFWQVGQYLSKRYQKTKPYQAVDLLQADFALDAFRKQNQQLAKQLFGNKGAVAQSLADKLLSDDKKNALSTALYDKLAQAASLWAKYSLAKQPEFAQIATLELDKQHALANKMAMHNRMLVSCGALTAFWGLKGVVADTAWLLLISLKSIYEMALIYNKPLVGKDGIRLAYGILAHCDLKKLQEKQVVMTASAMANTLFGRTFSPSFESQLQSQLQDELQKLISHQPTGESLLVFEDWLAQLDLTQLKHKVGRHWLGYLLPVGAGVITVHYNNVLLEQVLGVARATFEDKTLLLQNKS